MRCRPVTKRPPGSTNPLGPVSVMYRVFRGGSWYSYTSLVRSTYRTMTEESR